MLISPFNNPLALVFDDDHFYSALFSRLLKPHFHVLSFHRVENGLRHLDAATLVICDLGVPSTGDRGVFDITAQARAAERVIITSDLARSHHLLADVHARGFRFLGKPFSATELFSHVGLAKLEA